MIAQICSWGSEMGLTICLAVQLIPWSGYGLSYLGVSNMCVTISDVPAPLATKIYYSQRNHHLRRAICHMFFEEPSKESSSEVSNLEALQVNVAPAQTSSPGNFNQEQVANQQVNVGHSFISGYIYVDNYEF